ncbi:cadherin-86C [Daktulosphaira vitifoliae]|uniref:cadherin-86C n=1 Tax=Daktulosphaira vitifoliae TaxID=58002 RepID=UPI0021AACC27|nr:cadherin-86C [Daktulosphaira vitifoliae]XP_050520583.1 cadherin-86C [Daktulosphaira vitifoliae]XP_050520584.1 cadherin-86C [Daktulosphaira vitifoliae]XP_050520585.1 cadherin-86C [Daktulosphaira vitifoliae]XP_050520586.1 cadherin-86C [Daktulosphaira vitifoliae]
MITHQYIVVIGLLVTMMLCKIAVSNYPVFEGATELRELLIPSGVHIGSLIYRLRASDHDKNYPLYFQATDFGSYVVRIENLPCPSNTTSSCQADMYLDRVLIPGQTFQFRITVRDTRGDTTTVPVTLIATEARNDIDTIFPHIPAIIIVPEDIKVGSELEYVIVRKNIEVRKSAGLELRGTTALTMAKLRMNKDTTTGTISVVQPLDFETRNMYRLQVVALDMYVDPNKDSRNAAAFEVIVVVEDVQDTPPIFVRLETIVYLHNNMSVGDVVTKVEAIDGDKGKPRKIKYGLVSENRPFTVLFEIGLFSGEIKLKRPMSELIAISKAMQPAILTVIADEEVSGIADEKPAMSTEVDIALILDNIVDSPPYFHNSNYVCHLNENSAQGTVLAFGDGYVTQVHDDNTGKDSVYALTLENNNGTFEVSPGVIDRRGRFTIVVRNNRLLDFESRQSVYFEVVATELSAVSGNSKKTRAPVVVYLNDINDNPPRFTSPLYTLQLPENATAGSRITTVEAVDPDTGTSGSVRYTAILGFQNSSLILDPQVGTIVLSNDNHGFDREKSAEYRMAVEARDMDGNGLVTTVPLIIQILDINDETPTFQNIPIQFVLTQDMRNFTEKAFIRAIDKDAEAPNNIVRYEIINGNYNNRFILNSETGELSISDILYDTSRTRRESINTVFVVLTVRAYDLGIPNRWTTTQVRIYPPSSGVRQMSFLVPSSMDLATVHILLEQLTGGKITINSIKPYYGYFSQDSKTDKNIVVATVVYNTNTVIDTDEFRRYFYNYHEDTKQKAVHNSYKDLSFWLNLLLLIAILLAALSLLCCCCYQQYFRLIQKKKFDQEFLAENKGTQVSNPSIQPNDTQKNMIYILSEKRDSPFRLAKKTKTVIPHNKVKKRLSDESLLLEDVEGNEYRILDKQKSWSDETVTTRQEMFFKQGNAEILRIMSNDSLEVMDSASNLGAVNVHDEAAGKKVIMNKFLSSQPEIIEEDRRENVSIQKQQHVEEKKKDDLEEEQKKMMAFQRDVLLTRFLAEEQQKFMTKLETRSLPGADIATQTEVHTATQTINSCLKSRSRCRNNGQTDCTCSKSAQYPRRSSSMPHRKFISPIIEETGSGSGTSLQSLQIPSAGEHHHEKRKSRSYCSLRDLELDKQLQYMTPSLRSRAIARRRLSTSLPPGGVRLPRTMQMLEKKSVFSIAYGDVATQKINCSADSSNNWD